VTLTDAIRDLSFFDDESTIYAAKPWSAASQVVIAREGEAGGPPQEVQDLGLKYFLEVFVARDVLEDSTGNHPVEATIQDKVRRLIRYAEADA
jgi:hypothetical protein